MIWCFNIHKAITVQTIFDEFFFFYLLLSCFHWNTKLWAKFCYLHHKMLVCHDLYWFDSNVHKHEINPNIYILYTIFVEFQALIWNRLGYFMILLKMHFSQMARSHPIRNENVLRKRKKNVWHLRWIIYRFDETISFSISHFHWRNAEDIVDGNLHGGNVYKWNRIESENESIRLKSHLPTIN